MRNRPYRELIGGLIYLANALTQHSQPAHLVGFAQTQEEIIGSSRSEYYATLKATSHYGITYTKDEERLRAYSDSDWAGDVDRKSCSGNVLTLATSPISWKSRKQASVALSTMEAEYAALSEVSREVVYLKRLLTHMGFKKYVTPLIRVFCDNQSAIELSKNAVFHKRSKHININFQFTRELIRKKLRFIIYRQIRCLPTYLLSR